MMSPLQRTLVALLVFGGSMFSIGSTAFAQPAQPPAIVVVSPVLESELPLGASFVGATEGARVTVVGSAVDGRVREMFAEEGDEITYVEGEPSPPLVQLKTETIERELDAAKAELENRQLLLVELEQSHPEDRALLQATHEEAVASVQLAQRKFDLTEALYERQGTVTKEQYDEAIANLEIAKQRQLATAAELRRFDAILQLRLSQLQSRVTAQEAEVSKLEDQLSKHTIRAPFTGGVVRQGAEIGDWVARGQVVAEIVELDPLEIRVFVPEEHIASLHNYLTNAEDGEASADVLVTVDALPGEAMIGRLHRIVPQADPRSRSFPVLIRVDNPRVGAHRRLGTGMLARATLPVGAPGPRTLVPKDALVLGGRSPIVVVAQETADGLVAKPVPVTLGTAVGNLIVVQGELSANQRVVVEGNERLRPGQTLQILSERAVDPPATSLPASEATSSGTDQ
ncbi:MAG: efflux RND transporter periplasmic adaptor subunit [Pirellulaceae bacterium]